MNIEAVMGRVDYSVHQEREDICWESSYENIVEDHPGAIF